MRNGRSKLSYSSVAKPLSSKFTSLRRIYEYVRLKCVRRPLHQNSAALEVVEVGPTRSVPGYDRSPLSYLFSHAEVAVCLVVLASS
jgi:hypothetical protein